MENVIWPGWKTIRVIGSGSYGKVYEIERQVFGRTEKAALKVITLPRDPSDIEELYNEGYDDESITQRFQSYLEGIVAEYSLMAEMKGHTNVVYCEDLHYIQHKDGLGWDIYIKMELLTPLMKTLRKDIPDQVAINVGRDICRALALCKSRNIVHRDIKPQNIFVSKDGDYKLGDFGIAKTAEKTMGGTKIGTYKYMAPEVYNNQPYGAAADIYSLGMVLYWLLNERRTPFLPLPPKVPTASEEENSRYRRFRGEPLPPPAHGSEQLKQIVLKACAFSPSDRYPSAEELLHALETVKSTGNNPTRDTDTSRYGIAEKNEKTVQMNREDHADEETISLFFTETGVEQSSEMPDSVTEQLDESLYAEEETVFTEPPEKAELNIPQSEEAAGERMQGGEDIGRAPTAENTEKEAAVEVGLQASVQEILIAETNRDEATQGMNEEDQEETVFLQSEAGEHTELLPSTEFENKTDSSKEDAAPDCFTEETPIPAKRQSGDHIQTELSSKKIELQAAESNSKKGRKKWLIALLFAAILVAAVIISVPMIQRANQYHQAMTLYDEGKFSEAEVLFAELENYKDSESLALDCRYQDAIQILNDGDWKTAKEIFQTMDDYSEAERMLLQCDYVHGQQLLDSGEYDDAKVIFLELGNAMDDVISVYEFAQGNCTWLEAQEKAAAKGGHLACFETKEEYEAFLAVLEKQGDMGTDYYFGGRREKGSSEYYWVDSQLNPYGEIINSEEAWCKDEWLTGEPTFSWNDEEETVMQLYYSEEDGKWVWNDVREYSEMWGHSQYGYIIEYERPVMAFECDYQKAVQLLNNGDVASAKLIFEQLGSYADSAERVMECDYCIAESFLSSGEYEAAGDILVEIPSYQGAKTLARHCYVLAVRDLAKENRITAAAAFLYQKKDIFDEGGYYYDDCDVGLRYSQVDYDGCCDAFYLDYYIAKGVKDNNTYTFCVLCMILDADGNIYSLSLYNGYDGYEEVNVSSFNWNDYVGLLW